MKNRSEGSNDDQAKEKIHEHNVLSGETVGRASAVGGGEHPINLLCQPFLPFDNEQKEKPTEDGLSVLFVSVFCQHRADDIGSIGLVRVGEKNSKKVEK